MPAVPVSNEESHAGHGPRLHAHLSLKVAVMLGLTVGIVGPYGLLQRVDAFPLWVLPILPLDRAIEFAPAWTPVYLSVCALVPLSILVADRRSDLRGFAWSLAGMCVIHYAFFFFLPAEGPRPPATEVSELASSYRWLISVDASRNAFPSLHAALTVFCLGFALRVTQSGRTWRAAGICWGAAILFGTLATKQHFVVDILAGGGLGAIAHATAQRLAIRFAD